VKPQLIVRLPNWIGDSLMALPTLERLAQQADLHLLGRPWAVELFSGHGWGVTGVARGLRAEAQALRLLPACSELLLTHSLSTALSARLAGRRPFGFSRDWRGLLLSGALAWSENTHEARRYWSLGRLVDAELLLGLDWTGDPPSARLRLHTDQVRAAEANLANAGVTAPFTVIAPLATGTVQGRPKQWPGFSELATRLHASGVRTVAIAPPGREPELAGLLPGAVILRGLPTGVFAAVMAQAARVIANDSGPMHLAAAVGTRTIGVFGVSDPRKTGAWGGDFAPVGGPEGWPTVDAVLNA
jgi:heptosyltransferase-2